MKWLTLIVVVIAPVSPAAGAYLTGNDLHRICKSLAENDSAFCAGYAVGAFERHLLDAGNAGWCPPERLDSTQFGDVLSKYLEDHPSERDLPAASVAGMAAMDAWWCGIR